MLSLILRFGTNFLFLMIVHSFIFEQDTKVALDGIEMLQHLTEKQLDYVFKVRIIWYIHVVDL